MRAHQDSRAHTHSCDKQDHHIHDRTCGPNRRKGVVPDKFSYNYRVRRVVSKLKQIPQHQRDRKPCNLRNY